MVGVRKRRCACYTMRVDQVPVLVVTLNRIEPGQVHGGGNLDNRKYGQDDPMPAAHPVRPSVLNSVRHFWLGHRGHSSNY